MSNESNRALPEKDSMAYTSEPWTRAPPLALLYRVQTVTEDGEGGYRVRSWVVERERMGEFFTEHMGDDEKLVDVRPYKNTNSEDDTGE